MFPLEISRGNTETKHAAFFQTRPCLFLLYGLKALCGDRALLEKMISCGHRLFNKITHHSHVSHSLVVLAISAALFVFAFAFLILALSA